jgi:hypothetical protein
MSVSIVRRSTAMAAGATTAGVPTAGADATAAGAGTSPTAAALNGLRSRSSST